MPEPAILDAIIAHKREEVGHRKARRPSADLRAQIADTARPSDFVAALRRPKSGHIGLIAEIKKASPSAGVIRADFNPAMIARTYAANPVDCLSVLTDERFFQGHDLYLQEAKAATSLPILRKDFTIDPYQVYEARALGADAILLIVAALPPADVAEFGALAEQIGMAALVEVHTEKEMEIALEAGAKLIGINSRDLKTFRTDLSTVTRLVALAPEGVTLVAESGIKTPEDVAYVANAGARAILVGETLMRAPDIGAAVQELLNPTSPP